ncbi:hypothetical protein QR680_004394 [Steinernema hermaphroditum]|uniref:F-box domain-containing protein n=1 Tax=Steinernema hermaphroditum TaxID=289476 RepID=A0AA39HNJ8_9BILA|nr:hypothetical protein QR680_004394 [Steinernema hermaphroditum]
MERLPPDVMERIAGIVDFNDLPVLAEALKSLHGWPQIIEDEMEDRFEVLLTFGVHEDVGEDEVLLSAKKLNFGSRHRFWYNWDQKRKHRARLTNVFIREAVKAPDNTFSTSFCPCEKEKLKERKGLLKLPVTKGLDFPSTLKILSTPRASQKRVLQIVEKLPRYFEEITLSGLVGQPDLVLGVIEHFRSSCFLSKLEIRSCDLDSAVLPALAELLIQEKKVDFHAFCDKTGLHEIEKFKFNNAAVKELIQRWRDSDGNCNGRQKKISFWMVTAEWNAVTTSCSYIASAKIRTSMTQCRNFRIDHASKKSSMDLQGTWDHEGYRGCCVHVTISIVPCSRKREAYDPQEVVTID